jgi:hypothetical protein
VCVRECVASVLARYVCNERERERDEVLCVCVKCVGEDLWCAHLPCTGWCTVTAWRERRNHLLCDTCMLMGQE